MPSFDIICEVDLQEIDNAINQVTKEINSRFDFRGGQSKILLDKSKKIIQINADDDMKLRSIHQILENKLAKRQVDCRHIKYEKAEPTQGNKLRQEAHLRAGLDKEEAKKITKKIKNLNMKVQAQIQDQQVRVTGKKIDDLQTIISELKKDDLGIPLQYINMRG